MALKQNKIMKISGQQMNLDKIIESELTETQTDTYHRFFSLLGSMASNKIQLSVPV